MLSYVGFQLERNNLLLIVLYQGYDKKSKVELGWLVCTGEGKW